MTKYLLSFLTFFICFGSLHSQDLLLDSAYTYVWSFLIGGPQETTSESKYTYDKEKRLVKRVHKSDYGNSYQLYFYFDDRTVFEDYFEEDDKLNYRHIDYFNSDGFITAKLFGGDTDEGEPYISSIDSFYRDDQNVLLRKVKYYVGDGSNDVTKNTVYQYDQNGNLVTEIVDTYKNTIYKDSITYTYEDDLLVNMYYKRRNSNGNIVECLSTSYDYFDDHYFELIEYADDEKCEEIEIRSETDRYYSDSDLYEYDSVFVYAYYMGERMLFRERRYKEDAIGDDLIVSYEGGNYDGYGEYNAEYNGKSIYKDAALLIDTEEISQKLDVIISPTISSRSGLINIELNDISKADIFIFDLQGQIFGKYKARDQRNFQVEAPSYSGVYIIKINNLETHQVATQKVIIH